MSAALALALFDLDGTLVDSAPDIADAVNEALVAAALVFMHAISRRTMALAVLFLGVCLSGSANAQGPVNTADEAWRAGDFRSAAEG